MTRLSRRVMATKPLPRAEVEDRAQVRAESSSPVSMLRAELSRGSRTWSQGCAECGSVLTFHGSLEDWLSKSAAWDDVHRCDVAVSA